MRVKPSKEDQFGLGRCPDCKPKLDGSASTAERDQMQDVSRSCSDLIWNPGGIFLDLGTQ